MAAVEGEEEGTEVTVIVALEVAILLPTIAMSAIIETDYL